MFYDVVYYDDYGYEPNLKDGWHITVEEDGAYTAVRSVIEELGNCKPGTKAYDEFLEVCVVSTSDDDVFCSAYRLSNLAWEIHMGTHESGIENSSIVEIPVKCLEGEING